MHRTASTGAGAVRQIVSGDVRSGTDVAKALALGDNNPRYSGEYEKLGSAAGFYADFQDGRDPAGITPQDLELASQLAPTRRSSQNSDGKATARQWECN